MACQKQNRIADGAGRTTCGPTSVLLVALVIFHAIAARLGAQQPAPVQVGGQIVVSFANLRWSWKVMRARHANQQSLSDDVGWREHVQASSGCSEHTAWLLFQPQASALAHRAACSPRR